MARAIVCIAAGLLWLPAGHAQVQRLETWYHLLHDPELIHLPLWDPGGGQRPVCSLHPLAGSPEDDPDDDYDQWDREMRPHDTTYWTRCTGGQQQWAACRLPAGDWHLGLVMIDDSDRSDETVDLRLDGTELGTIVGDYAYGPDEDDRAFVYALDGPVTVARGQELVIELGGWLGFYRIRSVVLSPQPLGPPAPEFHDLAAHTLADGRTQLAWWTQVELAAGEQMVEIEPLAGGPVGLHPVPGAGANHRLLLADLEPGADYRAVVSAGGRRSAPLQFTAGATPEPPAESRPRRIPLRIDEPTGRARSGWPVLAGVPFPPGELAAADDLVLRDDQDALQPLQAWAQSTWPDGSLQWVGLAFAADSDPQLPARYSLQATNCDLDPPAPSRPVSAVAGAEGEVVLDNGRIKLALGGAGGLLDRLWLDANGDGHYSDDERLTRGGAEDLELIGTAGGRYQLGRPDGVRIVHDGPLLAEVQLEGRHVMPGSIRSLLRYRLRVRLFAGQPWVALRYALDVDGPEEMTRFQRLSLRLRLAGAERGTIGGRPAVALERGASLLQDYDFQQLDDGRRQAGRDPGWAGLQGRLDQEPVTLVAAVEDFWQTYPKGFALDAGGLRVDLLPRLAARQYTETRDDVEHVHSLFFWCTRGVDNPYPDIGNGNSWGVEPGKGGQYQLRLGTRVPTTLRVGAVTAGGEPAALAGRLQAPLFAVADPDAYLRSGWFGAIDPALPGYFCHYESRLARHLARIALTRDCDLNDVWDTSDHRYGRYGFMNYGDDYPEQRGYNWRNLEYDPAWAMLQQFARTGRTALFWRGERAARHLAHIDIRHRAGADQPHAPAELVGLPWKHCVGHTGGFFPTPFYLDDPKADAPQAYDPLWVEGGIDYMGHAVLHGLLTAGLLAADTDYVEVGLRAADQIARLAPRDYGFSQLRRPGWVAQNLASAYMASGDPTLLNAARFVVDRALARQQEFDPQTDSGGSVPLRIGECSESIVVGTKTFDIGVFGEALLWLAPYWPATDVEAALRNFALFLVATNYNPATEDFWYFYPPCDECDCTSNSGSIVMATLAAGQWADPSPALCRVQNVLLHFISSQAGRSLPGASALGFRSHSLPRALYLLRRQGYANTAAYDGSPPDHQQGAACQHPCDPDQAPIDRPGCGAAPREVCGDGLDNDLDGEYDEAGFYADRNAGRIVTTACPEPQHPCTPGELAPCGSDVGACRSGRMECLGGAWGPCSAATGYRGPTAEQCNGIDDDCDGLVDEGLAGCAHEPHESCGSGPIEDGGPPDGGTPDGASLDGGSPDDGGVPADPGPGHPDADPAADGDDNPEPSGGCGCAATGATAPAAVVPWIGLLLALARRRRPQGRA
jgi:MYXO-CTERM domain-containing protein